MQKPTFEDAARLWPRLSDDTQSEGALDDALIAACEEVILAREIRSPDDALLVCQVLLDNIRLGQRSDELDVRAMTSLRDWAAKAVAGGGLADAALFRRA